MIGLEPDECRTMSGLSYQSATQPVQVSVCKDYISSCDAYSRLLHGPHLANSYILIVIFDIKTL